MREVTDPGLIARLESGELPAHPMAEYGPAVRHVESRGNPNAVSRAGAVGADQFMPATAAAMGLDDPRDPTMSAVARDLLLAENYARFKDPVKALQAYNAGPNAVVRGKLAKETQEYAPKVLAAMGKQPKASEGVEVTDPELIARLEGLSKPKASATEKAPEPATISDRPEGTWEGVKSGVTRSAAKTIRALGTTLLPKSLEKQAEEAGYLPSQAFIEDLGRANRGNTAAGVSETVLDIGTDIIPGAKVMKGANLARQALPRAAALGAGIGGVRSEGETSVEILRDAAEGAAGGLIGEGLGRGVARAVTPYLKPSEEAKRLMARGIYPTMGDAADKSTLMGKALRGFENQVEAMPIFGMPQRTAKSRASKELFTEAAGMAVPPGASLPVGTKSEVLDRLGATTSSEFGRILNNTDVSVPSGMKSLVDKTLEQAAKRHNVSEQTVGQIKRELNEKLWSGVSDERMSGQALWNITEDMFQGLNSVRGNTNAQKLVEEIAGQFKNHLNVVAGKQGHNLSGLRQASANLHALGRVGGDDITGANLMAGVLANNRATGGVPTPKLQALAEDASGTITRARNAMGSHNPLSLWRDLASAASMSAVPVLAYGAANNSKGLKELLMRDPKYRASIMKALASPSAVVGAQSTLEEQ